MVGWTLTSDDGLTDTEREAETKQLARQVSRSDDTQSSRSNVVLARQVNDAYIGL